MIVVYSWLILALVAIDLIMSALIIIKMSKQEKFHTSEAHANLELINQSLNRLSEIAEQFEHKKQYPQKTGYVSRVMSEDDLDQTKEKKVLSLINRGESPKAISKKLGISRSEVDLLVASEKLGNGWRANKAQVHEQV